MGRTWTASTALPFERIETTGESALATWEALRDAGRGFPVIVGGDASLGRLAEEMASDDRTPEAILAAAGALEMPAALYDLCIGEGDEDAVADFDAFLADIGEWPAQAPSPFGLTVALDKRDNPLAKVHILLIPARTWAEVPAHVRLNGGENCPAAEYHVAALRAWDARYGIEIVGMSDSTLNLRAARRPATRQEALGLAREHLLYCYDLEIPLAEAAASLMAHDWWYFWWD